MPTIKFSDNIKRLKPYIPGKPVEELQRELGLKDVIKLASNENPLGPSQSVMKVIQDSARNVFYYPEGAAPVLRQAVAKHLGIDPELLVFGNGSDEVLQLLTLALISGPEDEIVIGDPSFAMYEIYATAFNATLRKVALKDFTHDLSAMADAITPQTKLIFIANPNNPTGTYVGQAEIKKFLTRVPDHVTVVFDEAYFEYVDPSIRVSTIPYVLEGRNVVVTRTFSKVYALAGLRIGYGIAPKELAQMLDRVRSPFNANLIAQAAATAAITDTDHLKASIELNTRGRKKLEDAARQLDLPFVPSQGNFVLIDVGDAIDVYNKLLRMGVIVRPCAGFGLPRHIRITVGTDEQLDRCIAALGKVLGM
jgi:histidinol-phosphate aminotransferase